MKKPNKKSNSHLSVNEFKSWMSGVEDMQESGWVPNKTQWERIRSKIALLSDEIIEKPEVVEPVTPNFVHNQPYVPQPVSYQAHAQQPTYFEPQQFEVPQFNPNDSIVYSSGEVAEFI